MKGGERSGRPIGLADSWRERILSEGGTSEAAVTKSIMTAAHAFVLCTPLLELWEHTLSLAGESTSRRGWEGRKGGGKGGEEEGGNEKEKKNEKEKEKMKEEKEMKEKEKENY